jgi:FdhE protein
MSRTTGGVRTDTASRLAALAEQRPEWHSWTGLLETAWRAVEDSAWTSSLSPADVVRRSNHPDDLPLLHGRTLHLDEEQVRRLVHRLASEAAAGDLEDARSLRRYRPSSAEAMMLVAASVRQQADVITELAIAGEMNAAALASLAHLAALPLLHSAGQLLQHQVPTTWRQGFCPICAAWPVLAERRGLDRSRRLRCGRCAADWEVPWLYCIYCGEQDHKRLGSLQPADEGDTVKVETCASCRGYLKSLATLQGYGALELLVRDLETLEFDLAALQRDYRRPAESGFALQVDFLSNASRRAL